MQFNEYLKKQRNRLQLTQAELSAKLGEFEQILQGVDANTISRWERSLSTPTILRQKAIVLFFKDNPSQKLPFKSASEKSSEDLNTLIFNRIKRQKFDCLVGALPKLPNRMNIHKNKAEVDANQLQFLVDFDYEVLNTDAPIHLGNLKNWLASSRAEYWYGHQYGQLAMHFLALNLPQSITKEVLTMCKYESSIELDDLVGDEQKSDFHIVSTWANNREAVVGVLITLYKHLHAHRESIQHVTTIVGNNDGLKLANVFGLKPVYHGAPITDTKNGVTLHNKKYTWVSLKADINDVLCTPIAKYSIASKYN